MRKLFPGVLLATMLMLTGCVGLNMTPMQNPVVNTSVNLQDANFNIVRYETATISCKYVLGIGGLTKANLRSSAINELYKKADLQDSQALVNVNTSMSFTSYCGFVIVRNMTASGYVVQFLPDGVMPEPSTFSEEEWVKSIYDDGALFVVIDYDEADYAGKDLATTEATVRKWEQNFLKAQENFMASINKECSDYQIVMREDLPSPYANSLHIILRKVDSGGNITADMTYHIPGCGDESTTIESAGKGAGLSGAFAKGMKNLGEDAGDWINDVDKARRKAAKQAAKEAKKAK